MPSASKKRRRREREKRAQDLIQRARSISLVDAASPESTTDPSVSSSHIERGNPPNLDSNNRSQKNESTNNSPVDNPVSSETNLSNEPSWKRVDFVLPRANGKKRFVFDKRTTSAADETVPNSQENGNQNGQKEMQHRTSETIEDIFGSKRQKERNAHDDPDCSPDNETDSRKKVRLDDNSDHGVSEVRRRKLSDAFEAVKDDTKNLPIGTFVDMPKTTEHSDGGTPSPAKKIKTPDGSSPTEALKASNSKENGNGMVQRSSEKHREKEKSKSTTNVQPAAGQITGRTVKEAVRDKRGLRPRANSTDGELNLPQGGLCDERKILEAHKWNADRKYTNQTSPRGFHNLGNTCFLNATLQCLTYLPPLCQTLIAISENKSRTGQNGGKKKTPQGQKITSSLCSLFQQAHGLNNNSFKTGGAFAPKKVVGHLPNIGSCGSRNGYKFRLGRQEDAHEFLVHLLDAMNDGELRAAGINQNISGWRDRLPVSRLDETTFVHRIFGGYFRSQVRCRRCNYRSNTYDPFLDLSLEVSKKSSTSVLNALSEFTRKETLDAANQWKCSGCKKYVCATKQLTVFRPPLTLCIQLKRFSFDNFGFGQKYSKYHHGHGGGSKITKPIEFPGTLNLPLSDNRSCQYTLTGIVIHVGGSSQSGHYTAYVKKPGKNGANQWYHMDDSEVQPVSERTVLRQRDAYLLFYCRTEVKLEFPDPPARSMTASEATEFGRNKARARANSLSVEIPMEEPKESKINNKETKTERMDGSAKKLARNEKEENNSTMEQKKKTNTKQCPKVDAVSSTHAFLQNASPAISVKSQRMLSPSTASNSNINSLPENQDDSDSSSDDSTYNGSASSTDNSVSSDNDSAKSDCSDRSSDSSSPKKAAAKVASPSMNGVNTSATKRKNHDKKFLESGSDSEDEKMVTGTAQSESDRLPAQRANNSEGSSEYEEDGTDHSASEEEMAVPMPEKQIPIVTSPKKSPRSNSSESESSSEDESHAGEERNVNKNTTPNRNSAAESSESESDSDDESSSQAKKKQSSRNSDESSDADEFIEDVKMNGGKETNGSVEASKQSVTPKTSNKTNVVENNSDSRGKVKVMLGHRKRQIWESKASAVPSKGSDFQLLGNMKVSQWGDEEEEETNANGDKSTSKPAAEESQVHIKRKTIINQIEKQSRDRKRKMHLDRWDSHLDQGRQKKVKAASSSTPHQTSSTDPKKNVFQRIQSSVQRMKRGKPKGNPLFRRKLGKKKGKF